MFHRSLRSAVAVCALALVGLSAAYALNVPTGAIFSARLNTTQQVHYYRLVVNFNDPGIAAGVKFGRLPANTYILSIDAHVKTVFNAATTNVLTMGTSTTATEIFDAATANASINEASATVQHLTAAAGLGTAVTASGEVDLYVKYTQSGTAATTGQAVIVVAYIPDNDL